MPYSSSGFSFFFSCVVGHKIHVHQDGSARVEQDYIFIPDGKRIDYYQNSSLISDFTSSEISNSSDYTHIKFKIEQVDSLGAYLTFFKPDFITFNKNQNEVTLSLSGSEPFVGDAGFGLNMRIEFDQEIRSVISNHIKVKKDGNKAILINRSRRQLMNKGRPAEIKIILKE